jgi:hypothetical protein
MLLLLIMKDTPLATMGNRNVDTCFHCFLILGQGLGNAALGLQAVDAAKLGGILARNQSAELRPLVRLMERCSSAALSWVTGLNPGAKGFETSAPSGDPSRVQAASMVVHSLRPGDGQPAPFVLPWSSHWWSGNASCGHKVTATPLSDSYAASPKVMSIVNGLQPTGPGGDWTVGFTELYMLHDGAMLQGVVSNSELLDRMSVW